MGIQVCPHGNLCAVIPAKAGIQTFKLQPFPINSCYFSLLDSRFRGNDDGKIVVVSDNAVILNDRTPACTGMTMEKLLLCQITL